MCVALIGRNCSQRVSHLAVGLDPSQVSLNPVAGAGFVCSGAGKMVSSHPNFLVASTCLGWDVQGFAREHHQEHLGDLQGAPVLPALDTACVGCGRCWAAGEPWLAAELSLRSAWRGELPKSLRHGGGGSEYLLGRGLSVYSSVPTVAPCMACFYWVRLRW